MLLALLQPAAPAAAAPAADTAAVARGAYLAAAAGCDQCHTAPNHGAPYAGGRVMASPTGTVVTPNITPDRKTGIGGWSAADFVKAMRWGVAPDDTHYLPVFPYLFYARLSDGDLADLKAFLDNLPAVANTVAARPAAWFHAGRARAAIAVAATGVPQRWHPDPRHDAAWNRGAYLVATVGRCGECHSPRTLWGAPDMTRFLAGDHAARMPDITPDPTTGIGKWSEDDIVTLLEDGKTPDFDFVHGEMSDIVRNTARLTDVDRRAIAVYLRSLPAKKG